MLLCKEVEILFIHKKSMAEQNDTNSKLDVHKYNGKNADDVVKELEDKGKL